MARDSNAPVLIKRKKVVRGGGHHGGAWKVAYADFVTAMMAFFMLMWLLNATTEQQRKGLADYFAPDVPISRTSGGSDGLFGGHSPTSTDVLRADCCGLVHGIAGESDHPASEEIEGDAAAALAEVAALEDIEDVLLGRGGESLISDQALRHVVTRLTDEGLIIEIFALPGAPIFDGLTAEPLPVTRDILGAVARVSNLVTNPVAVAGYVPSRPVVLGHDPVWSLSTERADTVRRVVEESGIDPARIRRVTGHGDRSPAAADPLSVRNDRIEITLLRRGARALGGP